MLGIAGLPDSGRDELPRLLTDRPEHASAGLVRVGSDPEWVDISKWKAPAVALLPPDRGREGIVGPMTVRENMSISVLDEFGSPFWLSHRKEKKFVADWMGKLDVVDGWSATARSRR